MKPQLFLAPQGCAPFGLVHFVAASGLLHRFLETRDAGVEADAEAYYLLGIAESHIVSSMWTDQTSFFLETAIRLRPHSPLAGQADCDWPGSTDQLQRPAIAGSVLRVIPHSSGDGGTSPAGVVASFYAVKQDG